MVKVPSSVLFVKASVEASPQKHVLIVLKDLWPEREPHNEHTSYLILTLKRR